MRFLQVKWMVGVAVVIGLLMVAAVTGRKSVHIETLVPAEPTAVWQVLVDINVYRDWNSILVPVAGELVEQQVMKYEFTPDGGERYLQDTKVRKISEGRLLNQTGGLFGVITFDHRYILEPTESGTRLSVKEDYRGIGVHFWDPTQVKQAYSNFLEALRARVIDLSP